MRGIIFSRDDFVHTVFYGSKTQFRVLVRPAPDDSGLHDHTQFPLSVDSNLSGFWGTVAKTGEYKEFNPRYKVGEVLYLKEPYFIVDDHIFYLYDNERRSTEKWCSSLSMPCCVSRYFIEIKDIRCERIQSISSKDCVREGILYAPVVCDYDCDCCLSYNHYRYSLLFDKYNGKCCWDSNPFVWVYTYKLIDK